jgi:hydroxyacylglutathione hydrolase
MSIEIHCLPDPITNCYLIKERGLILVDAAESQKADKLLKKLQPLSINPKDISLVLVTHAHWDHAGALGEWKKLSACKVAVSHHEKEWVEKALKPQPGILSVWGISMTLMSRIVAPLLPFSGIAVDIALDDGGTSLEPFGISGRVLHTPGHTKGSMSVLLETGDAFVGDLAMNGFPYRPGPGMPSLGEDADQVKKSWRLILDSGAKKVFPGHGKPFDADVLRKKL